MFKLGFPVRRFSITFITASLLASSFAAPALAQDSGDMAADYDQSKWGLLAGAGSFVTPKYSGDDNYRALALPFLRVSYGDKIYASVPEGANYDLWSEGGLKLTAKAGIAFPRDEDGKSLFGVIGDGTDELLGLGDLGASIELGGNVSYDAGPVTLSAGLRHGLGGHGSIVGDASVSYTHVFKTPGPPIALILSPNIKFGEADLTQSYYGITDTQAANSGLDAFQTSGGIYSAGVTALSFIPTSKDSAFILFGSLRELTGDAAKSPLVRDRGNTTQAAFGLFWVKAFGQDARNAERLVTGR